MNREIYNIVLVHTSREWERVRVTQPHQEMPYDNIGSVDEIESIASRIYYNDVMQGFIKAENRDEYWIKNQGSTKWSSIPGFRSVYSEPAAVRRLRPSQESLRSRSRDDCHEAFLGTMRG